MRPGAKPWTESDVALLFELVEDKRLDWPEVARRMGRGISAVSQKYCGARARRRIENGQADQRAAPNSVLIDRNKREAMRDQQSITARLFGDPPPGYSALDRRRG